MPEPEFIGRVKFSATWVEELPGYPSASFPESASAYACLTILDPAVAGGDAVLPQAGDILVCCTDKGWLDRDPSPPEPFYVDSGGTDQPLEFIGIAPPYGYFFG